MNRTSRVLLVLAAGAAAACATPATPAAATDAEECWSYSQNRSYPEGTRLESPVVSHSGHYTCTNGRWVASSVDCHVTYGGWSILYRNQIWIKEGEYTTLRGRGEVCQNGTLVPAV